MTQDTTTEWRDVTSKFMDNWTQASTEVWKNWFDLMGMGIKATTSSLNDATVPPAYQEIYNRINSNQETLSKFLRLSFDAWQDILEQFTAGKNWQDMMINYSDQMRQQVNKFATSTKDTTGDAGQLWQVYIQQMQKYNTLWADYLEASVAPWSKTFSGTAQPWLELNKLYWEMWHQPNFGNMIQSPMMGISREFNAKLLKTFDTWSQLYQATTDYQIILAEVQVKSFEELMQELVKKAEKKEVIKDWREFQQIWSVIADDVYEKTFSLENNVKVRGKFLNTLNAYRIQQRELMEIWMSSMNIPTRSEVDEMHKSIYDLRKEVKNLRKQLEEKSVEEKESAKVPNTKASKTIEKNPPETGDNKEKPSK